MNLLKSVVKAVARAANNANSNRKRDNVQKLTYEQTGRQLEKAKKTGKFVNASALYQKNLEKNKRKIEQKHSNLEKFIDSI